jgi:hypothetical protein
MKRDTFIQFAIVILSLGGGALAILTSRLGAQILTLLSSVSWNF